MLNALLFVAALALIALALLGLDFLISSIGEREERATRFAALQLAAMLTLLVAFFWLLASLVLSGLYFAFGPRQRLSPGENYARQLGKKYQQRIAEAIGQLVTEGDKIISLASMEDQIKIADELGKPLIHEISGETGEVHNYYVSDGNTYFRFTIDSTEKDDITGEPSYRTQIRRTIAEAMRELGRRPSSSSEKDTKDSK